MLKILLGVVAIQSLIVVVALSCFWVRGHSYTDDIFVDTVGRMSRYRTSGGGFWFETRPRPTNSTKKFVWQRFDNHPYPIAASSSAPLHQRMGFLVSTTGYDLLVVAPYWSVVIPLLCFLIVFAYKCRWRSLSQFNIRHLFALMTFAAVLMVVFLQITRAEPNERPWLTIYLILAFLGIFVMATTMSLITLLITALIKLLQRKADKLPN